GGITDGAGRVEVMRALGRFNLAAKPSPRAESRRDVWDQEGCSGLNGRSVARVAPRAEQASGTKGEKRSNRIWRIKADLISAGTHSEHRSRPRQFRKKRHSLRYAPSLARSRSDVIRSIREILFPSL